MGDSWYILLGDEDNYQLLLSGKHDFHLIYAHCCIRKIIFSQFIISYRLYTNFFNTESNHTIQYMINLSSKKTYKIRYCFKNYVVCFSSQLTIRGMVLIFAQQCIKFRRNDACSQFAFPSLHRAMQSQTNPADCKNAKSQRKILRSNDDDGRCSEIIISRATRWHG
jgi:hypothetical protein